MDDTKPTPKILLYGNSIFMETLASKIQKIKGWEVKRTESGEVGKVNDNFIVADLCDAKTSEALPMLCALSRVTLIGVDPIANTLTVLTGRTRPLNATQGVLDALKKVM